MSIIVPSLELHWMSLLVLLPMPMASRIEVHHRQLDRPVPLFFRLCKLGPPSSQPNLHDPLQDPRQLVVPLPLAPPSFFQPLN